MFMGDIIFLQIASAYYNTNFAVVTIYHGVFGKVVFMLTL